MNQLFSLMLLCLIFFTAMGCNRTLFPNDKPITQFDAYKTRRYGPIITERRDAFGASEPVLEERLLIRDN